jgi:hypothetical protein
MYFKDYLKATGDVKKTDTLSAITDSTKGALIGTGIGAGSGLFIGFGRNKNLLLSAAIGGIVGGVISKIFIK